MSGITRADIKHFDPAGHKANVLSETHVAPTGMKKAEALEHAQTVGGMDIKKGDHVAFGKDEHGNRTVQKRLSPEEFSKTFGDKKIQGFFQSNAYRANNMTRSLMSLAAKHPVYTLGAIGTAGLAAGVIGDIASKKSEEKGQKEGAQAVMRQMAPQMQQQQAYY